MTDIPDRWGDKTDQWSTRITAAHPMNSGDHDTYTVAMEMVGNRRSKAALVELVNWLLKGQSMKTETTNHTDADRNPCPCGRDAPHYHERDGAVIAGRWPWQGSEADV